MGCPTCKSQTVYDLSNDGQLAQAQALIGAGVSVEFTVGAETGGNTINVALQAVDAEGDDVEEAYGFLAWLSDAAGGDAAAAAPSGGIAIGTDGTILTEHTADITLHVLTEADGDADLDIVEAGAATWYLNVLLPDGTIVSSGAITFA